jgi:hypothetical protein
MEQVAADLKMQLIFSTPGKPRGRGQVERFFDTVSQSFLSVLPGYPGSGRIRQEEALLSLAKLDQQLRTFLLATYHEREPSDCRHPADTPPFTLYFDLKSCQFLYGKHCRAIRVYGNDSNRVFRICSLAICGYRVTTAVKPPTCNAMR